MIATINRLADAAALRALAVENARLRARVAHLEAVEAGLNELNEALSAANGALQERLHTALETPPVLRVLGAPGAVGYGRPPDGGA